MARVHVRSWQDVYAGLLPQDHIERRTVERRIAQWEDYLRKGGRAVLVACDENGSIVGFASGGSSTERVSGYDAEIETIYLLPEAQRQKTGERLLRAIAGWLRGKGFRAVWVRVLSDNSRARRFYEKLGAEIISETTEDIDGFVYREHLYGWRDLATLSDPSPKTRPTVSE